MLDNVLESYDMRERHEVTVRAAPERALAEALAMPAGADPVVRILLALRRIGGARLPLREFLRGLGFAPVVETDLALVCVCDTHGLRLGFALWTERLGEGRARLATETRVRALEARARIGFRIYWLLVGPFSALIRRRWLAAARHRAESGFSP